MFGGLVNLATPIGATSPGRIVIGIERSGTGRLASSAAPGVPAYKARADSVNFFDSVGGINDDAFNPVTSISKMERLVIQDHVIALVDQSANSRSGSATHAHAAAHAHAHAR
jgi:hypothetical protein